MLDLPAGRVVDPSVDAPGFDQVLVHTLLVLLLTLGRAFDDRRRLLAVHDDFQHFSLHGPESAVPAFELIQNRLLVQWPP